MLTYFMPLVSFYCPFSEVIKRDQWHEWVKQSNKSLVKPLSANPTEWSNTLKQFVGKSRWIVWECLTILWGWRLKGWEILFQFTDHWMLFSWFNLNFFTGNFVKEKEWRFCVLHYLHQTFCMEATGNWDHVFSDFIFGKIMN